MNLGLAIGLGYGAHIAGFAPTDVSGCVLWLRADLGVTIATGVSAWADQSGSGDNVHKDVKQATGARQPTRNASDAAYNHQATLSLAAASVQFLQSGTWATPLAQTETIFIVGNFDGVAANQYLSDGGSSNERVLFNNSGASGGAMYAGAVLDSGVALTSNPIMLAGQFGGATSKIWVSSLTPKASGSSGGTTTRTGLTLGASFGATANLNGKIAEVIIYSSALSAPNFAKVAGYIGTRYGISIGA